MHVVIAGGTGLIGRALCAELLAAGHAVTVLSRRPKRARLPRGVRVLGWDGRTVGAWGAQIAAADAVVNLAGANIFGEGALPHRWTAARKRTLRESRLAAGCALAEAVIAAERKPRVFVQASAVGYYGPRGDEAIAEDAPHGNDFLAQLAVAWEAASAAVEPAGVRRVIARTGIVLSADGGALPRLALPFRLFLGGPIGSGRQWLPWIHIADEVGALRFLLEQDDAHGPFNLSAPHPLTNADFGRALARVLRRPYALRTPAWALRLALGELATVVLEGQRAVPQRLLALGYVFRFPHAEDALRDLLTG